MDRTAVCRNIVVNSVFDFLWSERWSGEVWITIKKLIERVAGLVNTIDVGETFWLSVFVNVNRNFRPIGKVKKRLVPVIWCQVVVRKKVGAQYRLADVGDNKSEWEGTVRYTDITICKAVTRDR